MEKYLVRTRRSSNNTPTKSKKKKVYNQLSIVDLKGVVIVEDLVKLNTLLRVPDQDSAVLVQSLEQLSKKIPSRDLLKSTKIGHAVKRLSKHSDDRVSKLASQIFNDWKIHFETKLCLPVVDVQCDRKSESLRQTARKHISAALRTDGSTVDEVASDLAKDIEFQVFHEHRRIINGAYQRCMRRMVLALQQRNELRQSVTDGKLTVVELVSDFKA